MISYHLTPADPKRPMLYAKDFKTSEIAAPRYIAKAAQQCIWSGIVWKDGARREENFLFSDWCLLDFDEPGFTLAQAERSFCDMKHVIGTTKSHGKEKRGVKCDRFRVALPWSERINDLRLYRWNMWLQSQRYPLDSKALDGARFFFPCTRIVSINEEGYEQDVDRAVPADFEGVRDFARDGTPRPRVIREGFPFWLTQFLAQGVTLKDGRNYTCFRAMIALLEAGIEPDQARVQIASAPFERRDFSDAELRSAVHNGLKRFELERSRYGQGSGEMADR